MMFFTSRKAFTLIELLIVVAIIGILASIAVPNFLNAQLRAKIARVKSDMKSLSTALESYQIDHNAYPDFNAWETPARYHPISFHLIPLTTPVSYIGTVDMQDPFLKVANAGGYDDEVERHSYNYRNYNNFKDPFKFNVWCLNSMGPDMTTNKGLMTEPWARGIWDHKQFAVYHISNGLVSAGDIAMTGGDTKFQMPQ
ncbi:prepilin-type N-terminal cleavage/methylation domain-containing protein [bacterium]|nr:prepilin-type N-terminal cleavage/methylation domain-containing protein [bacterium]